MSEALQSNPIQICAFELYWRSAHSNIDEVSTYTEYVLS